MRLKNNSQKYNEMVLKQSISALFDVISIVQIDVRESTYAARRGHSIANREYRLVRGFDNTSILKLRGILLFQYSFKAIIDNTGITINIKQTDQKLIYNQNT